MAIHSKFTQTLQLYIHSELPHELHNWLVEMDMVRSENIERLIESAEDDDSESVENEDEEIRSRTQRAAAVNTKTLNKYLWPDNRIPYAFHSFISKLLTT